MFGFPRPLAALVLSCAPVALLACQTLPPNPATFNFDRPADVDLVCLDVAEFNNGQIATFDRNNTRITNPVLRVRSINDPACAQQTLATTTNSDMHTDTASPTGYSGSRLFALVTQSDRGEIAVVNLHTQYDTGIVDNDRAVPGYTFIPVGSFPGAVSVDPRGVATYVANTGESTISVIDNATLLASPTDVGSPRIEHRYARDGSLDTFVTLALPGHPSDVQTVAGADGKFYVYATVPLAGVVAVFDVTDPGAPITLPPIALRGAGPGGGLDGGTGGFDGGAGLDGGSTGDDAGVSGTPTPEQFAYDGQGQIFVSDRGLGFVHVLSEPASGGPYTETAALVANAPTRAIAATPLVRSSDPSVDGHRFVYAADARDGTVLVLDADPAISAAGPLLVNVVGGRPDCERATFDSNTCARIDPLTAFDRVPLVGTARVLTVVTREGVDDRDCVTGVLAQPICTANPTGADPSPTVLRGVQVLVGIQSGQIQVIDVEDPDRDCPGRRTTAGHPPFQPHLPRANLVFGTDPSLSGPPTYVVNGASASSTPDQPQIAPISGSGTCDATNNYCVQLPVIAGGDGGVNAYAVRPDTWTVSYEGPLPGLTADNGSFRIPDPPYDPGTSGNDALLELDSPGTGFCTLGVLPGDRVLITRTSPFVPDVMLDAGAPPLAPDNCSADAAAMSCFTLFGDTTTPHNREMIVVAANNQRLVLQTVPPQGMTGAEYVSALRCCYPEATPFEVRPAGAWTVVGIQHGYHHNVSEVGGSCVADPALVPTGRLITGQVYHSNDFDLLINPGVVNGAPAPPARGDAFGFATTNGYIPLALSGGLLPGAMKYFCQDRRLYVIDQSRNSLDEYAVQPISTPRSFN